MKRYKIEYPTLLSEINADNDNIDVFVTCNDGEHYVFVFATPENLKTLMDKERQPFIAPKLPFVIVAKLIAENIERAIQALFDEPNYLYIYGRDAGNNE
jgi:hypothetical protein